MTRPPEDPEYGHAAEDLTVEHRCEATVVAVTAHALVEDLQIRNTGEQLSRLADAVGPRPLWINFGRVERLASQALGQLVSLHKKVHAGGGELVLCNLSPPLLEVFRATGLDRFLSIRVEADSPAAADRRPALRTAEANSLAAASSEGERPRDPVLLWEPQSARAERLRAALAVDFDVVGVNTLEQLPQVCQTSTPLAVVLLLPEPAGTEGAAAVWRFLRSFGPRLVVVAYADTARLPVDVSCQALLAGVRKVVHTGSPTFADDVRQALNRLVRKQRTAPEDQERLTALFARHGFLARSAAIREVFRRAAAASAVSELPVLLLGESGTGKQRLAEAIHHLDPLRSRGPFCSFNCTTLHSQLAESELFGHRKGAFSGAEQERLGLSRAAHGGTLLLDEIGDLDVDLQPKLLRALQEGRVRPLGSDHEHAVDVRVIAATHRPLSQLIAARSFREDLYQRLNVFLIRIPPLRERPEDVEVQARHFLRLYQTGVEGPVEDYSPAVLEVLRRLPWEGNTRQLENFTRETLAHHPPGPLLELEDLPRWVLEKLAQGPSEGPGADPLEAAVRWARQQRWPVDEAVGRFERRLIQATLVETAGNRTQAAAALGLTRQGLLKKIKKHRLGDAGSTG